jgi:hypothetical protein
MYLSTLRLCCYRLPLQTAMRAANATLSCLLCRILLPWYQLIRLQQPHRVRAYVCPVQMLIKDSRVTAVHMTGSEATYNRIMWGDASPGTGKRLLDKPFTAELGCITPFIVVPSNTRWSKDELAYHAMHACQGMVMNAGHNCNGTEIVVTAKGWPQREEFVQAVREFLGACHQRWVWYPQSKVRSLFEDCKQAVVTVASALLRSAHWCPASHTAIACACEQQYRTQPQNRASYHEGCQSRYTVNDLACMFVLV